MKSLFVASLLLASTAFAQTDLTLLSTKLPDTFGQTSVLTRFVVNSEMKEIFAKIEVNEQIISNYQICTTPYDNGTSYPYPFPGTYCHNTPQTRINSILSEKVKIEGMTMNGDEVIFQAPEGDVVCGKMGKSRIFKISTLFLSGKCNLEGSIKFANGIKTLTVKFKTK